MMQRFYTAFNAAFHVPSNKYVSSLAFLCRHKWITAVILLLSLVGIWWAAATTPTGFVPNEDRGMVFTNVELAPGASLDRTVEVTQELSRRAQEIPGVAGASMVNGFKIGRAHV